jgi:hypothetical protein
MTNEIIKNHKFNVNFQDFIDQEQRLINSDFERLKEQSSMKSNDPNYTKILGMQQMLNRFTTYKRIYTKERRQILTDYLSHVGIDLIHLDFFE